MVRHLSSNTMVRHLSSNNNVCWLVNYWDDYLLSTDLVVHTVYHPAYPRV